MTAQEIFDKVTIHLLTQGEPSVNEATSSCMYRGDGGRMCAVGVLIPDHAYDRRMEGKSITDVLSAFDNLQNLAPHTELLQQLQGVHDQLDLADWPEALDGIATNHPEINSVPHILVKALLKSPEQHVAT